MKRVLVVFILWLGLMLVFFFSQENPQTMKSSEFEKLENSTLEKATFAGGCFWCLEAGFENYPGVEAAIAGYTGGQKENPTYQEVSSGTTGHYEAVRVYYDPEKVNYSELLDNFWRQIDPTDEGGQFADRGSQYRTAIFYHTPGQKALAEESKAALEKSGKFDKPIVTEILSAKEFYPAEEYHQDYSEKNPADYGQYKKASGREDFIKNNWEGE